MSAQRRVVVGITGATGAVYAVRLLRRLREAGRETHLIASAAGVLSVHHELGLDRRALEQLADVAYAPGDVGAAIASGSFAIEAMVVAPCSMKSLAAIALGMGDNLLTRAADVVLKEQRKLVLMPRETPLHVGHCRLLLQAAEMGAIIAPPMPAFYNHPRTLEESVDHSVGRVLDLFDIESGLVRRWQGPRGARR